MVQSTKVSFLAPGSQSKMEKNRESGGALKKIIINEIFLRVRNRTSRTFNNIPEQ